jgi:hypothetical protein
LGIGVEEDGSTLFPDPVCSPVVDVRRRVIPDAGMTMILVIPAEESATVAPGVLEAAEPVGEIWPVLEGPELGFAVGVVVALTG